MKNTKNGNKMDKKKLILDFINGPLKEYLDGGEISFGKFKERINETCGTDFSYSDLYPSYLFNAKLTYEYLELFEVDSQYQCKEKIPGTFIACGEGVGEQKQYCSNSCYQKSKENR